MLSLYSRPALPSASTFGKIQYTLFKAPTRRMCCVTFKNGMIVNTIRLIKVVMSVARVQGFFLTETLNPKLFLINIFKEQFCYFVIRPLTEQF